MPRFDRLSATFKNDPQFHQVMSLFYADILEFHRRAYKYFRQRGRFTCAQYLWWLRLTQRLSQNIAWKLLFDSLWKTFKLRFDAILQRLRKHRDLVDKEAQATDIADSRAWRANQLELMETWRIELDERIGEIERDRWNRQTREAVTWLGASEEHDDILMRISSACENSHWAISHPQIVSWLGHDGDAQPIWLNGNPGTGKSLLRNPLRKGSVAPFN